MHWIYYVQSRIHNLHVVLIRLIGLIHILMQEKFKCKGQHVCERLFAIYARYKNLNFSRKQPRKNLNFLPFFCSRFFPIISFFCCILIKRGMWFTLSRYTMWLFLYFLVWGTVSSNKGTKIPFMQNYIFLYLFFFLK